MITSGEAVSLATPLGVIMEKFWAVLVSRLLENAFAAIVQLKIMSDTDAHSKAQPQSPCFFM